MNEIIDAIILAGDGAASNNFAGQNKALLSVGGLPLLVHVLRALDSVARVQRIVVVGPARDMRPVIEHSIETLSLHTPVEVLEQGATAYDNFWAGFTHCLSLDTGLVTDPAQKLVLVAAADTPLISAAEVDEFLDACDTGALDYCIGMTAKPYLQRYLPDAEKPGIEMTYLNLDNSSLRVNNLHLIRPNKVSNLAVVEEAYEVRYQKNPLNMFKVALSLLRIPGLGVRAVSVYLHYQLAMLSAALGFERGLHYARSRLTRAEVSQLACILLGTRVGIVETTIGGCAVDVDNAEDYDTLCRRFVEFSAQNQPPAPSGHPSDG